MGISLNSKIDKKSTAARYLVAVLAAAVALALRAMLSPLLGTTNPYHTVWVGVVFSAWYCGVGPAVATTLMSALGVWFWFLPRLGLNYLRVQVFGMAGFLALSAFIIALREANRRSKARAEQNSAERLHAEQDFKILANSLPELCWMAKADGHIFWYNERWYEYTGTTPQQMMGWGWQSVHDPEILPSVLERWNTSIRTGEPFEMEFPLRGADGEFRWFLTRTKPLLDRQGNVVRWLGANTNIHQQRELQQSLMEVGRQLEERVQARTAELNVANQSLSQLSARLLQLQDEERRRLARELHDSVGQMLAAIKMNIAVVQSTPLDSMAANAIAETASLINQINMEIRTISHLLHPPLLDEVGLSSALRWYLDGFSERSKIAVNLDIASDIGRLGSDKEIAIFRIVQECLTNVHRHARSSTAAVRLARVNGRVRVEITDAGKGMSLEKQLDLSSPGQVGVGFRGMRERIAQLGGALEVRSDQNGTVVVATLPHDKTTIAAREEVA